MTVFCIECGAAIDAADAVCNTCGAAQTIDEDAPVAAPSFPTAAVVAVTPPPEPEPEPLAEEPELPAPSFPTAAVIAAVTPPPVPPAPEPLVEEPELPAPSFPTAAVIAAVTPPPVPPAPEPPAAAPATVVCTKCGSALVPSAQFCGNCGTPRAAVAQPAPPPPPPGPAAWQASLPAPFRSLPVDLLAACALMAVAGLFTLWPVLRIVPDLLDLLTSGESFGRSLGLLALAVWLVLAFAGGACFVLAWRLAHADRVARGLGYVLVGGLAASILIGNARTTSLIIAMLAGGAAVAVLAFAPGPRAFLAAGAPGSRPDGIVIARTLVPIWAGILIVVGLLFLPIGTLGSKFVVAGILFLALAGAAIYFNRGLAEGDPVARIAISAGAVVYLVLLFVLGERNPGLLLPLALAIGVGVYLWVPADVQRYFANRGAARA